MACGAHPLLHWDLDLKLGRVQHLDKLGEGRVPAREDVKRDGRRHPEDLVVLDAADLARRVELDHGEARRDDEAAVEALRRVDARRHEVALAVVAVGGEQLEAVGVGGAQSLGDGEAVGERVDAGAGGVVHQQGERRHAVRRDRRVGVLVEALQVVVGHRGRARLADDLPVGLRPRRVLLQPAERRVGKV